MQLAGIHEHNMCDPLSENRPSGVEYQNLDTNYVGYINNGRGHSKNLSAIARSVVELVYRLYLTVAVLYEQIF